jgi:CRISPR-associated protein Cst2
MAFVTGVLLIDAPASALNNAGSVPGSRTDNTVAVKYIRTRASETYPYVSAQAFRYWLRTTLEQRSTTWKAAPIYREEKVAVVLHLVVVLWYTA